MVSRALINPYPPRSAVLQKGWASSLLYWHRHKEGMHWAHYMLTLVGGWFCIIFNSFSFSVMDDAFSIYSLCGVLLFCFSLVIYFLPIIYFSLCVCFSRLYVFIFCYLCIIFLLDISLFCVLAWLMLIIISVYTCLCPEFTDGFRRSLCDVLRYLIFVCCYIFLISVFLFWLFSSTSFSYFYIYWIFLFSPIIINIIIVCYCMLYRIYYERLLYFLFVI